MGKGYFDSGKGSLGRGKGLLGRAEGVNRQCGRVNERCGRVTERCGSPIRQSLKVPLELLFYLYYSKLMKEQVIVLAFSNDRDDYLDCIVEERKNIYNALRNHDMKGFIRVEKSEHTSIDDLFDTFNLYRDRIALFHYGGHAGGTHLQLESGAGKAQLADAGGLAQLMGREKELRLVFLNGCATKKQVVLLLDAGVKAVIATSVPINDNMATEFAEQFFKALVLKQSIGEAFKNAQAKMRTYGSAREIKIYKYRDVHWKDKEDHTVGEMPWGLYYDENHPGVLDWKLPDTPPFPTFFPDGEAPYKDSAAVNTQLVEILTKKIAPYSILMRQLIELARQSDEIGIGKFQSEIINSFPIPVGKQLRRLFAGSTCNNNRLRQLVLTYNSIVQLTCFIMLSQLWEECTKNRELVIGGDFLRELQSFYTLRENNFREFDYVKLARATAGIFKKNQIEYFVEELSVLEESFRAEDEFYRAYLFLEKLKASLLEKKINPEEVESLCIDGEKHLSAVLSKLSFFVKYRLATVKRIEVIKYRFKDPKFKHRKIIQYNANDPNLAVNQDEHDSFTEHESVFLFKDVKDVSECLSLSPFVVDKHALEPKKSEAVSLLFFYSYPEESGSKYYYNSFDKEDETFAVSDKNHRAIKEQFPEFKKTCLPEVKDK